MIILGVDPGISGGAAVIDSGSGDLVIGFRMPVMKHRGKSIVDAAELYTRLTEGRVPTIEAAVIEQVNSMPGQGHVGAFTFGRATGAAEAVAMVLCGRTHWVTPAAWKKHFKLGKNKRESLDACRFRFGEGSAVPAHHGIDWKILANDGIAEAALIATWYSERLSD
jgi:hypothetical protein